MKKEKVADTRLNSKLLGVHNFQEVMDKILFLFEVSFY